ncbi:hypothetical protein TRFO_28677 [Tritrichomonas foetus]|uniref:Uncharacterized protein n=1 Tax=Tritrichomonas foetus TaxID=1144522 RepID=A0A1J4JZ33_9EUKA|nr:hypothetical protein TRFO_28677 [Tritrichomonas foetus]|eukprot:OHT03954.1 hypothetical protein TRFO_28677 [Tritrichomonas foetus]
MENFEYLFESDPLMGLNQLEIALSNNPNFSSRVEIEKYKYLENCLLDEREDEPIIIKTINCLEKMANQGTFAANNIINYKNQKLIHIIKNHFCEQFRSLEIKISINNFFITLLNHDNLENSRLFDFRIFYQFFYLLPLSEQTKAVRSLKILSKSITKINNFTPSSISVDLEEISKILTHHSKNIVEEALEVIANILNYGTENVTETALKRLLVAIHTFCYSDLILKSLEILKVSHMWNRSKML